MSGGGHWSHGVSAEVPGGLYSDTMSLCICVAWLIIDYLKSVQC